MKKILAIALFFLLCLCACSSSNQAAESFPSGPNVVSLSVGNCGPDGYINEPCASVTVCVPGTSNCQQINNILVDTGSYGLRIYQSVLSLTLTQQTSSGHPVAECTTYADYSADWGPVAVADVVLGSDKAPSVPIQLINSSFPGINSADCGSTAGFKPDTGPSSTGFNGILGVGLFTSDCGPDCQPSPSSTPSNNYPQGYYSCNGSTCSPINQPESNQVSNPVAFMPKDNNGVGVILPSVPSAGAANTQGVLILGIDTESNNVPGGVTTMPANDQGNFYTQFNGQTQSASFLDSGSNELYFPGPGSVPLCSGYTSAPYPFCPSSLVGLTAIQIAADHSQSLQVQFQITNSLDALNSGNGAFADLGASVSTGFAWGLPFFLGRTVWVGISGTSSNIGVGPYWAY